MASTHTWHPGSDALEPGWPVPTDLLPDEILSSWLVRSALRQGCDPLALTCDLWPGWRPWTVDVDRMLPPERLNGLSRRAGMDTKAIQSATLLPVTTQIRDHKPPGRSIWPWMLALGARNTKRRSGLQYCPECLAEGKAPYFRIQWRFAWHTCCTMHGCSLHDRCWQCHASIEPHRLDADAPHLARCASCDENLCAAPRMNCSGNALAFQSAADNVLLGVQSSLFGHAQTVSAWFEVVDFFISLVRRSGRSRTKAQLALFDLMGLEAPSGAPAFPGASIEYLSVADRQEILGLAWGFLGAEEADVLAAVLDSGISQQGLADKRQRIPPLLEGLISLAPDAAKATPRLKRRARTGLRPRHEVERMMARLVRKLDMKRR
ncbi:TniQ family protein [Guyparkeria sp. SCN-R1]|uniref:TniQ family protein n=1 Tax=Guyparkeria sp. SCN-R1 TaxID=2341113 RepID=UPI0013152F1A